MKSTLTTYVLIVTLSIVWGVVAKKLFFTTAPHIQLSTTNVKITPPLSDDTDTALYLKYRDPFSVIELQPTEPKIITKPREKLTAIFQGSIFGQGKRFYLIQYHGQQHNLRRGESLGGFRLSEAWKDSITLTKEEHIYTLYLTQ